MKAKTITKATVKTPASAGKTISAGVAKAATKRVAKKTIVKSSASSPVAVTGPAIIKRTEPKIINMALQGGGAHGAFGWGVMDKFLEDGRVQVEGLSGTSAGSMNAVVYAYGMLKGNDGARQAMHDFWKAISDAGQKFAPKKMPWDIGMSQKENPLQDMMKSMMSILSPYQMNPMNYNPLKEVLEQQVDFEELERSKKTKLFICATNVRTGKVKIFHTPEVTSATVLASACLPQVFQAVEINGEHYWDGGYMGNPVNQSNCY